LLSPPLPLKTGRWAPEKAVSDDVVSHSRRIGGSGFAQSLIELLVCKQRLHVCGGREAKEQAVRAPGKQRPIIQSRNVKSKRLESRTTLGITQSTENPV
jgi:hypothetical protein